MTKTLPSGKPHPVKKQSQIPNRLDMLKKQLEELQQLEQQLKIQEADFAQELEETQLEAEIAAKVQELLERAETLKKVRQSKQQIAKSVKLTLAESKSSLEIDETEDKHENEEQLTITIQKIELGGKTYYSLPTLVTPETSLGSQLQAPLEDLPAATKTPAAELEETTDPEEQSPGSLGTPSSPPETPNSAATTPDTVTTPDVVTETDFARHEGLLSSEAWLHTLVNLLTAPRTTPEPIDSVISAPSSSLASSLVVPLAPSLSALAKFSSPSTTLAGLFPPKRPGFFDLPSFSLEPAPTLGAANSLASTPTTPTPTPVSEYVSLRKSPLRWIHVNRKTIASVVTSGFVGFLTAYTSRALVTGPIAQQSTALQTRSVQIQEAGLDPFRNLRDSLIENDTCRSGRAYLMILEQYPTFAEKAPSRQLEVLGLDPKIRQNINILAAGKQLPREAGRCNLFK